MRTPILTLEQQLEYEAVKAEAAAMSRDASPSDRLSMCRKLSEYAFGVQHLGPEERYIMSRWPMRRSISPEATGEDDDELWFRTSSSDPT